MKSFKLDERTIFFLSLFIAIAYSFFLSSLPVEIFYDRPNYLNSLEHADFLLENMLNKGFLGFISNEPVWRVFNVLLIDNFDATQSLKLIIMLSSFIVSFFLLRESPNNIFLILIFLFFPLFIKNFIIHIRQGLAISVFLIGYLNKGKPFGRVLLLISGLIHSSFIVVIGQLVAFRFISYQRFSLGVRFITSVIMSLLLFLLIPIISSGLGARQSEHFVSDTTSIPILGIIIWGGLAAIFAYDALTDKTNRNNSMLGIYLIIFYIVGSFFSILASRIFESNIILVFLVVIFIENKLIRQVSGLYLFLAGLFIWFGLYDGHYFGMAPQ